MRIRPVAAGTLPEDLIDAIRNGTVTLRQVDDDVVIFCSASGGVEWHCNLSAGEVYTYRHQQTGAGGTMLVPHFGVVKKIALEAKKESTLLTDAQEGKSPPLLSNVSTPLATFAEVMRRHKPLAIKLVHFLAPAPKDHEEIIRFFKSESSDALDDVLKVFTVVNRRGQRELGLVGYELVDIESYSSKAVKQQVANLALPKVAHNKTVLDRFTLYADRDVMLAVCSKGIMAGLGGSKRQRDDNDDDSDEVEGDENITKQKTEELEQKAVTVLFTSMEQSDIQWDDGDLTKEPWVMSSAVKEVLARLQLVETTRSSSANPSLTPMPIVNQSQLDTATNNYDVLWKEYQLVYDLMRRVNEVSEAARRWCQLNAGRFADKLCEDLQRWFEAQEEPRVALTTSLEILHRALYQLKRDIEDYVNLREWGVLR